MTRIVVETERVTVRHWTPDDVSAFARLATDPRVLRYIGDGQAWSDERIRAFVAGGIEQQAARGWVLWPVALKPDDALVGICGFNATFAPDVEIGWWLSPEHWGKGLATEIARAVMEYGFGVLGFNRLISVAQPANRASLRVMAKLGMTFDRRFTYKDIAVVAYSKENPSAVSSAQQPSQQSAQQTPPSPGLFFMTVAAYQRSSALRAAIDLDLFTRIAEGAGTPAELAPRAGAAERGVRILCDYLVVNGFLTKAGGRYALTPDSATFLDRRSPAYLGGVTHFFQTRQLVDAFDGLAAAVRKGGTALAGQGTVEDDNDVWVKFAEAMGPMMAMPADLLAKLVVKESSAPMDVLDVAAGHGLFGIAFAKVNPKARVVATDWKAVLDVAQQNAVAAGVSDRFKLLPGSAFDLDFGTGTYDVILLPNFLHHFDPPTNEALLRKLHAALKPGGRVVIAEFIPDEGRVSPPESAAFALVMLATTPSGDAYTFAEYQRMLASAGYSSSTFHPLPPTMQQVVIAEK